MLPFSSVNNPDMRTLQQYLPGLGVDDRANKNVIIEYGYSFSAEPRKLLQGRIQYTKQGSYNRQTHWVIIIGRHLGENSYKEHNLIIGEDTTDHIYKITTVKHLICSKLPLITKIPTHGESPKVGQLSIQGSDKIVNTIVEYHDGDFSADEAPDAVAQPPANGTAISGATLTMVVTVASSVLNYKRTPE